MNTTRRSFSFGQNNRPKINNKPLNYSLPRQQLAAVATPRINNAKMWGNNIYRYQKSQAIKQIINDYFKQQAEGQPRSLPIHLTRRVNRYRPREAATVRDSLRLSEDLGATDSVKVESSMSRTSYIMSWHRPKVNQLPPINQQGEEPESEQPQLRETFFSGSYTESLLLRSSSAFSEMVNPETSGAEQTYLPAFQNQIFKVMIMMKGGRPITRVKEFKEAGLAVLDRQIRIKSYGLPSIWKQSMRNPFTYETGMQPPLKSQLCKITKDDINPQVVRLRPKALFKRIAADGFRQFRSLLRSFCQDLKKVEGKVINNKLNPDNVFLTKEYKLCLAQWGYSSFRDSFDIQSNSFESRVNPVLKGERNWLVSPEYLAPEVIDELLGQVSEDIWSSASSPDIWSLGLFTYEVMTLVPIWCSSRCFVMTKPEQFPTIRSGQKTGILGVSGRDLKKLQERQRILQSLLRKEIESWSEDVREMGHLILQMVEPRRDMRITLDELIAEL